MPRLADGLRDAEVHDDGVLPEQEYVVRLDVAVHDTLRVRVGEGIGDLAQQACRLDDGQRSLAREPFAQ